MSKTLTPEHIAALEILRVTLTPEIFPDVLNELIPSSPPCEGKNELGFLAELNLRFSHPYCRASFGNGQGGTEALMNDDDIGRAIACLEKVRDYMKGAEWKGIEAIPDASQAASDS